MKKKIINWIGRLLMFLSIIFIVQKFLNYRENMQIVCGAKELVRIGVCSILYAAIVYSCPLIYKCTLLITADKKLRYIKIAYIYCKSNILKYLPGNVMQYVGRNEIAFTEDVSHSQAALASMLEVIVTITSSAIIAIIFSGSYAVEWIGTFTTSNIIWFAIIILGICMIAALVFAKYKKKLSGYISHIFNKKNIKRFMRAIGISSIILILNSILYFYVLSVLGIRLEQRYYWMGIGLYSLSFVLGYIMPGVPGGIGVREAILVYFYSMFISESQILTGSIVFRIITILGDFIALIAAFLIYRLKNENGERA